MPKKIGIITFIILIVIIFVAPIRKGLTNLFNKNKGEITETQIIGTVSGFNGRVKEIQKILESLGFDPGSVDGRMGARTRLAIKEFQKKKALTESGRIDSKTWIQLNNEKEKIVKYLFNPEGESTELSDSRSIIDSNDFQLNPKNVSQKTEIQDNIMNYRLKSKDRTMQAQIALKKAGFYKGDIDGKSGPQTKKSVKAFQMSKGLNADGVIGVKTWEEIAKILKN